MGISFVRLRHSFKKKQILINWTKQDFVSGCTAFVLLGSNYTAR